MKWISVKRRLPKLGGEYIVAWDLYDKQGLVSTIMDFDAKKGKWYDVIGQNPKAIKTVKYWMELPKPPKL